MTLSARNRLSGTVTNVETDGPVAEVTVEIAGGDTLTAVITAASVERLGIAAGEEVDAVIKASSVMIES